MIHDFDEIIERRGTDSKKWNTYAYDVLPMWIADTDFKCPQPIINAMISRAEHGLYGYPYDKPTFEAAVKNWQHKRFGWNIKEEWLEFTPAVVPAIIYGIQCFTNPGDHIVIQTPAYHPFNHIISDNGRIKVENSLLLKDGHYEIDFIALEEQLSNPRTKLMILCNPHNPVGRVFTMSELKKIGDLCLKYHVIVIADEIHSDIVYPGYKHIPFATVSEEIKNNSLICLNPSKTFNIAGVRTGAVIVPNTNLHAIYHESVVNNKAYGRTVFGTLPFETAYNECDYYADQLIKYLTENLEFLSSFLEKRIPTIRLIKPEGTYLLWLDCRALPLTQAELMPFFLGQAKIALNDGATFGKDGEGFMRLNIACPRSILKKGLTRIETAVNKLLAENSK